MNFRQKEATPVLPGFVAMLLLVALPAFGADDARSAIEAANQEFESSAGRGDGPGVAALYTARGQLLPAQSDFVSGTAAIGEFWQAVFDSGIEGVSLVTVELESYGNTAYEVGKFELNGANGQVVDHGKYVVVWKKEGASWRLHRDIWTSSVVPVKQ